MSCCLVLVHVSQLVESSGSNRVISKRRVTCMIEEVRRAPPHRDHSIIPCVYAYAMSYQYHTIPVASAVADDDGDARKSFGYGSASRKGSDEAFVKGEPQPAAFRDAGFGVLFMVQLAIVITLSVMYATGRIEVNYDDFSSQGGSARFLKAQQEDPSLLPLLVGGLSSLLVGPLLTVGVFSGLAKNATRLMQLSIYMAIFLNVILTLFFVLSGAVWPAIATGMGAFFTWMYARAIWPRIPLAAANLKTAITSIQSQLGVAFLGLASIPLYITWFALWTYFFISTLSTSFLQGQVESTKIVHTGGFKGDGDHVATLEENRSALWYFLVFLMFLSFYWTSQVIGNTIQTSVAGAIGTFWFVPEEAVGCCSPGLTSSLFRSLTYSFGSICMGSLLVAIIQALRAMVRQAEEHARDNRDGGGAIILCLAQCLLSMLESVAEYFNKWAFIYVGLYGYGYMEAGHNVLTLFRERGWTSIITDNLTARVLGMMSFAVGLGTGLTAALLAFVTGLSSAAMNNSDANNAMALGSLFMGILLGMMLASIMFGVVNSAADTIIVLFAEAPMEFQQNHPGLAAEMNHAWSLAYPQMFTSAAPTMVV